MYVPPLIGIVVVPGYCNVTSLVLMSGMGDDSCFLRQAYSHTTGTLWSLGVKLAASHVDL